MAARPVPAGRGARHAGRDAGAGILKSAVTGADAPKGKAGGDPVSLRAGTDIASVDDVRSSLSRFGSRYLERVFTPHEIDSCSAGSLRAASLAARFAAKEATMKVLRPGDRTPPWTTIEVRQDATGACELRLAGAAAELAADAGISEMAVSLSHERDLAVAVVVARCSDAAERG